MGSSSDLMLHLDLLLRFYVDYNYSSYEAEFHQVLTFFFFCYFCHVDLANLQEESVHILDTELRDQFFVHGC